MADDKPNLRPETEALMAAAGIVVTKEGMARARAKLDAARARHTSEHRAKVRAFVGLPLGEDE